MKATVKSKSKLKEARERATMKQEDLAHRLKEAHGIEVTQATICNWEADPSKMPVDAAVRVARILGCSVESLLEIEQLQPAIEFTEQPHGVLENNLRLLDEYAQSLTDVPDNEDGASEIEKLNRLLAVYQSRPVLAVVGEFDSGKSTLLNDLLGTDVLPTRYQPATCLVTRVYHSDLKPKWMEAHETVLVCKGMYTYYDIACDEFAENHIVARGPSSLLHQFAVNGGEFAKNLGENDHSVVVFLDSPILKACSVSDSPGFDDKETDEAKVENALKDAHLLAYMSPANGYLKAADFLRISRFLKTLPVFEHDNAAFPPMGNVFLVVSHAHAHLRNDSLDDIMVRASHRLYRELGNTVLAQRGKLAGYPITEMTIRSRMFAYDKDGSTRKSGLFQEIQNICGYAMPRAWEQCAYTQLQTFKNEGKARYQKAFSEWESTLKNIEQAQRDLESTQAAEPERNQARVSAKEAVLAKIDKHNKESCLEINDYIDDVFKVENLETSIRARYEDKSDAKQYAMSWFLESIDHRVRETCEKRANELKPDIDNMIKSFERSAVDNGAIAAEPVTPSFDAKASFIGALAGLGAIGALALWAAAAGNLGGYLLIAQAVGWLSAIGIGVGGGAAAIGFVAAIGGPITIAIGLAVLVGLAARWAFGASWQQNLAKKIHALADEKDVKKQFRDGIEKYWAETKKAVETGFERMQSDHQKYIKNLESLVNDRPNGKENIEKLLKKAELYRDFFGGLPLLK